MEVELRDVGYTYDGVNYVFKELTLRFSNGFHLIVGPNGSGKTTLLKITSLIYRPSRGKVLVENRSFWDLNNDEMTSIRRCFTYVHEKALLIRGNVKVNLELGLKLRNINDYNRLKYYIDRYGMVDILMKDAKKLSAGQAKIVSLTRALAVKPKVLLLDEPLTHIDYERSILIIEDLVKLVKEGSTVIVATHYLIPELKDYIDTTYEIINGVIRVKP
ncbi:MAG: ATP-binding cassette domain-containing protein [Sulfolobales archaeon]|nr:ATP-binding cassette domain-containing protein [Sulfolobales archaeon]MCX8186163.1 ATP-binding cassette domain-containing protein [Sulfolobales archaeon]MDW7969458.1 ATP-binding cassette domain-containing protein [Sulfolobales archaeon]